MAVKKVTMYQASSDSQKYENPTMAAEIDFANAIAGIIDSEMGNPEGAPLSAICRALSERIDDVEAAVQQFRKDQAADVVMTDQVLESVAKIS